MNDFNRGALPIPCLRLDFGFGEQWDSVELGDGTGYVRLADYEKVVGENDRLRDENKALWEYAKLMHNHIKECCDTCGECGICDVDALTRKLRIEVVA